ncbi:MAG: phospholipase D family protein [Candidatus Bathyarchaeia archaeon]
MTIGLLVDLLIGLAIGYVVVSETEIPRLQQRIEALESQLADRDSQIAYLESQLSRLKGQANITVLGVYFSPRGGCEDQAIYWISRANKSIHILIYSFTLDSIGDALIEAHGKGVEVMIVFEKSQISRYSQYQRLRTAGIYVRNDTNPRLMHHKVMIIDEIVVLTGSFNWSKNAEKYNNENLIIIKDTYVAEIYEEMFQKIWDESI